METINILDRKSERGFTLVELAIVMIIIGLLIGGVLKGQELIGNAQLSATIAQVKAIDAATTTFRDKYDAFPGDMANANNRLPPSCAGAACASGNGNGSLQGGNPLAFSAAGSERARFFPHLAAADLLSGIAQNGTAAWGDIYPATKLAGGFVPASWIGGALAQNPSAPPGLYLGLVQNPGAAAADNTLTPNEALRIDAKLDDGSPVSGSVFASTAGQCATGGAGGAYSESTQTQACDLAIRVQN